MAKSFLRRIPGTGYIIAGLATALLLSFTTVFFMQRHIGTLNQKLGEAEAAIGMLVDVNAQNQQALNDIERELRRCAFMRTSAESRSSAALEQLAQNLREAALIADTRLDEIVKDTAEADERSSSSSACGTVPPRTTELLVAAARSANRGADGS